MLVVVNPRFVLTGPKARRYEFAVVGLNEVRVRRYEAGRAVRTEFLDRESARGRYSYLRNLGYVMTKSTHGVVESF